ncbi:VanW family protein [Scopulibacillus cellulosilyticus]|uniref:VanW family protein n=1 Tax=Scopulibacillus cellulosilyticus TaxID=2665665 RepID=A0ABW2PWP7_9BACL
MKLIWMVGLLLFTQHVNLPNNLHINQQDKTITTVNRSDLRIPSLGVPMIDINKYNQFINKIDRQIYRAPVNAWFNDQGNIVSEKPGFKLNREAFKNLLYNNLLGNGPSTIEVPRQTIYPKIDSELLSRIREKQIGQYVTYFNPNNRNRTDNISLAADAINNYVVLPNATFSFNKVVGMRTIQRGYKRAPVIVKGELSEGVGGGICQVSSTLFNAVDRAGLQIVQRYSHSKRVPYVPPGRDATVSWYGPDFRFQNKYNEPILIKAKALGGSMIVTIYSSDLIKNTPRKVPSVSYQLPKEVTVEPNAQNIR